MGEGQRPLELFMKCNSNAYCIQEDVFNRMFTRYVISYNNMLREYAIHGLGKERLSCLEWMCEAGVEMDRINLIAFLFSL